ncbi:hypothetical protein PLESTB_000076100 [Pleodorina starrii]|uniref:NOT2/NOT3/NOT5 C-terminal domain-containing protein n=1 Tax=Pleodorina starrii TaxID=330485 RepID=A0A9W6B9Y2_9CHLO|nr:hypothetical protein PLESTM_000071700 [Pleodorina starrii]GLC48257.1 hypothetical protein PLESTB_000076100 [Pleodorina starrii]GLC66546.1 hypothetical protein PLESTF_000442300 [Pleodorina starrii]
MLNPGGLDPSGARGFAQYGQQGQTAGFPLVGALQGGMQSGLPGVRTGIAGLQAGGAGPQQSAQNRFAAANTLQSNLQQQLGQYAQAQGRPLTNAQIANGVLAGAAGAGVRAQGIGGLGPLAAMRQPGVDRTAAANLSLAANLNAAAAGAAGAGLAGLQGYAAAQNPLAAALGVQNPQRLTGLGLNAQLTAAAAAGLGGLQGSNLQSRLQMANAGAAGLGLLQQGLAGALPSSNPNTHELLAILNRQKQQQQQQQQQQQHQQQQVPGGASAFGALNNLGISAAGFGGGAGNVGTLGGPVGGLQVPTQQPQQAQQAAAAAAAAAAQQQQQTQQHVPGDQDGAAFDNSDFPSLLANAAARQGRDAMTSGAANDPFAKLGIRTTAAAVAAGAGHGATAAGGGGDFQIQNEDFPALPGSSQRDGLGHGGAGAAQQQAGGRGGPGSAFGAEHLQQLGGQPSTADYETYFRIQQQQRGLPQGLLGPGPGSMMGKGGPGVGPGSEMAGGQSQPGSASAAAAAAAVAAAAAKADRFGLMGLLPLIKMTDADLTMLALGTDLTGLGLNLNAAGDLHSTLVSPLADNPIKTEPDFDLPSCYKFIPQRLQPGYLSKFKEETLFYMFYSMPGDEAQLLAADELSVRGWWFHRRYKLWMLHAPNTALQKSPRGERGSYLIFDINQWEIVQKSDLEILYEDIEGAPRLPRTAKLQQQPAPPAGPGAAPPPGHSATASVQGRH